ncbi:4-(cytidine 5'-diphospho)-2-C-methyl-D-erythritol kinase [Azovibrio restrictus]|uniref:4-(cytidine 5'-diphospho)-2-C-methyl-D-erythritol kinase n=1 Tax=Azovibrio restrictus TaxID=146938 RepID=UPI0026F1EE80|nr:4-(cytidine 5'-diphospho)-2-C-methyl-D-erythritol kinase [Azovibrio restrictus]
MTSAWTWDSAWPAPAKLNLFLHVVGRRSDGYHLLQTVFRFLDQGDTLWFEPRQDGQVVLETPLPGVPPETDLTVRAARLLQARTGCRQGVGIRLAKRLPMGGGLGGGSSDAATVLLALNHLWGLGLSRAALQEMGLTLGADVPIFVFGRNAFAEGVGERLQPVALPETWYLVLEPPVAVPTQDIFRAPDLCRDTPSLSVAAWQPGQGHNDLEPVACRLFPAVGEHLAWLRQRTGPGRSRMSGSGACVFASCDDEAQARCLAAQLPPEWKGWVARGLAAHPLVAL